MGLHPERTSQRSDPMGKTDAADEQVSEVVALDAAHAKQHKVRVQVGSSKSFLHGHEDERYQQVETSARYYWQDSGRKFSRQPGMGQEIC